jgi:hypothetical protein
MNDARSDCRDEHDAFAGSLSTSCQSMRDVVFEDHLASHTAFQATPLPSLLMGLPSG